MSQQAQLSSKLKTTTATTTKKKHFLVPQKRRSVLTLVSGQKPNLTAKRDYTSKTLSGEHGVK